MVNTWRYASNDLIIRENDPGESAYIIESGKVSVTKESNGKRIHIAFLGPGSTFGEMSMVDDLPRSASVTAVEETVVREFHRDDLYAAMKENPDVFGKFLKSIFERLREANGIIANMDPDSGRPGRLANLKDPGGKPEVFSIEGLTPTAIGAVAANPAVIKSFPFKIGRKSDDPFLYNHFEIEDRDPAQISRHHVSILFEGGRVGVVDRGSELGASVDGTRIGGKHGPGPVFFDGKEGILILGNESSPFQYRIRVSW
ncbi:MAG TPA: cyclic nucleotide-binding domain-containing protein [Fibrobacteria bacterium]|nr:cyclic nucleotide-binding domain-containing protein [Fibrobacteria bacterium]